MVDVTSFCITSLVPDDLTRDSTTRIFIYDIPTYATHIYRFFCSRPRSSSRWNGGTAIAIHLILQIVTTRRCDHLDLDLLLLSPNIQAPQIIHSRYVHVIIQYCNVDLPRSHLTSTHPQRIEHLDTPNSNTTRRSTLDHIIHHLIVMADTITFCIPIDHTTDYEQWHVLWKAYLEFYGTTLPEEQYRDTFARLVDPDGDLGGFVLVLTDNEDGDGDDEVETPKPTKHTYIGLAHYLTHTSAWAPASTRHCYLNDLYVDPTVRGTGGGRMLIEAVTSAARAGSVARTGEEEGGTRCSRVYWLTAPDNVAARRLYDKVATTNRVAYKVDL